MADIFISYSQQDRRRVEPLVDALTAEGYRVWWDLEIRAGESFDELIESTLEKVRCVVTVWSQHSVVSEWVRAESAWAKDQGKFVSIRIDEGISLPLKFYNVHTRSLVGWAGARDTAAFRDLLADITKIAGSSSPPVLPSEPKPKPAPTPPSRSTGGYFQGRQSSLAAAQSRVRNECPKASSLVPTMDWRSRVGCNRGIDWGYCPVRPRG